jgi:pantoate--beta-alanine ligase
MLVAEAAAPARAMFATLARPLGFVPTMGALHAGHLELIAQARASCASVAASIFVNPLQFGAGEDFEKYPRVLDADREALSCAGTDVVFTPEVGAMYPRGFATTVDVGDVGARYEGAARPGHFRGVATVVAKLLTIVRPDVLFIGQKDAQQAAVLQRLVADLSFDVSVVVVPTVREEDGLARSSRNAFLNQREREQAPTLHHALEALRDVVVNGDSKERAIARARATLSPMAHLEYFDIVDAATFVPLEGAAPGALAIGAARFGTTRLIDNEWIARS